MQKVQYITPACQQGHATALVWTWHIYVVGWKYTYSDGFQTHRYDKSNIADSAV